MKVVDRSLRFLSDEQLLAQVRTETFRGPGPGGQKRNKTSNSIRLTHLPSGISVVAGESRSQAENKIRALRRLRLRLAIENCEPIEKTKFVPSDWFRELVHNNRIE